MIKLRNCWYRMVVMYPLWIKKEKLRYIGLHEMVIELNQNQIEIKWNKKWIYILDQNEIAELLISHGSDVSAVENDGKTPLHLAAANGNKIE